MTSRIIRRRAVVSDDEFRHSLLRRCKNRTVQTNPLNAHIQTSDVGMNLAVQRELPPVGQQCGVRSLTVGCPCTRAWKAAFVATFVAVFTGCVPDEIVWLADSSGFIYTTGEAISTLNHYDVKTDTWRVVVADTQTLTGRPAVSSDGKQIATARVLQVGNAQSLQVLIYDMRGRLVKRTKEFAWGTVATSEQRPRLLKAHAAWVPGADRILVYDGEKAASCNLNRGTSVEVFDGYVPAPIQPSPIRPDGAGFLAVLDKDIVFTKWDGTKLEMRPHAKLAEQKGEPLETNWESTTARFVFSDGRMEIDTVTGTVNWVDHDLKPLVGKEVKAAVPLFGNATVIRLWPSGDVNSGRGTIDIYHPHLGVEIPYVPDVDRHSVQFVRSPDLRYVAIEASQTSGKSVLGVIDFAGRIQKMFPRFYPAPASLPPDDGRHREKVPDAYKLIASHLSDNIFPLGDKAKKGDFSTFLAEGNRALLDFRSVDIDHRELTFIAEEAASATEELISSMQRVARLPRPPGVAQATAEGFVWGLFGQLDMAMQRAAQHQKELEDLQAEGRGAALACHRLNAAKLLLSRVASAYSGPTVRTGQAVDVYYVPRWGPQNEFDTILLKPNITEESTLHNCTLLVEVRGESGEVASSVHFLPEWKQGEKHGAHYRPGIDFGTGERVCRQAVDGVERVKVSIWCDELTQVDMTSLYTRSEQERDVAQCCEKLKLDLVYQHFKSGFLGKNRGVKATMHGPEFLPDCRVTVSFYRKRLGKESSEYEWKTLNWDIKKWDEGTTWTFSSEEYAWDPEGANIKISFPDNDYVYNASLKLK